MKLYNIYTPSGKSLPVVASLPHSGTYVPDHISKKFKTNPRPVLCNLDWHLEKLYDFLPGLGITVIQATHNRYVVNLNRYLTEPLYGPERSSVVPWENTWGSPLYDGDLSRSEVEERIEKYYHPYHRKLLEIIDKTIQEFGRAYLLDLHSFGLEGIRGEVCLGDVEGATCSEKLVGSFESALLEHDFSAVRNDVWVGGYITRHYSAMENVETLQVELWFPVYLDRETFGEEEILEWDSDKFRDVKERMRKVFKDFLSDLLK